MVRNATFRHGVRSIAMPSDRAVTARSHSTLPIFRNEAWRPVASQCYSAADQSQGLLHLNQISGLHVGQYNRNRVRFAASDVLRAHLRTSKISHASLRSCCGLSQVWQARYHHIAHASVDEAEAQAAAENDDSTGIRHQASYLTPSLPVVFAHGLFGFDELILAPESLRKSLPGLSIVYWRGIADMLTQRGVEVLVTRVPMSASIEERAHALRDAINKRFGAGQEINLIGHSMGGLDARHLITHLETKARVRSLTTIASPHRGSTFADYMLNRVIGRKRLPFLLRTLEQLGLPGGGRAFDCLTRESMQAFNDITPNKENVHYLSWGAAFQPGWFNEFRLSHRLITDEEGDNDGLVSIESSKWGKYQGTLKASHLDLIGWTRKANSIIARLTHADKPFDARAFYLTMCEDLALLGL